MGSIHIHFVWGEKESCLWEQESQGHSLVAPKVAIKI